MELQNSHKQNHLADGRRRLLRSASVLLRLLRVLLVTSIAGPLILFPLFAWFSYSRLTEAAEARARHLTALLEEHDLKVFEAMELVGMQAEQRLKGVDWETISTSKAIWDEIKKLQTSVEQVGGIFIIDANADLYLNTHYFPSPNNPRVNYADRDYFYLRKNGDPDFRVGGPDMGRLTHQPYFIFSITKTTPDGKFDGVIALPAYSNFYEKFYEKAGTKSDNFSISLIKDDGRILVQYPHNEDNRPDLFSETFSGDKKPGERGLITGISPVDGKERLVSYTKIRGFPIYETYSIDRGTILSEWYMTLVFAGVPSLAFAGCLFLSSWLALRQARKEAVATRHLQMMTTELQTEIERRERAEASLLQAQRLEAVGQLTGGIAHDFNNLLMVISGNLEIASRRTDLSSIRRLLRSMGYATERAANLTRQLLTFSRRNMVDPKTVDLLGILRETRVLIGHLAGDKVQLRWDFTDNLYPVRIDVSEFEAAILNLAGNARDAMPEGGTLTLIGRNVSVSEHDIVEQQLSCSPGEHAEIILEDTGCGIPPDVLLRIYEPFFTTKQTGKGTGLGLSQVYGFVHQSGGAITITSTVGEGTRVSILLPRSLEKLTSQRRFVLSEDLRGHGTILIVEDDDEVRKVSIALLEEFGYRILYAHDATEALRIVESGEQIDLLFSDVVMPGMNGADLAQRVRSIDSRIQVLLTTGYPGHAELFRETGVDVLAKPFTRTELAVKIHSFFGRDHLASDPPTRQARS
jgi:two-component system, NtrC family, sensor kinase